MDRYKPRGRHGKPLSFSEELNAMEKNADGRYVEYREVQAEIDEAHKLLREGMEISKPKVKQLDMAVWRHAVKKLFNKVERYETNKGKPDS